MKDQDKLVRGRHERMIGLHVTWGLWYTLLLRLPFESEIQMTPAGKEYLEDPRTGAGVVGRQLYNYLPMIYLCDQ